MIDAENPVIEFTAEDRCDRCGAQAYTLARHDDLGEFLFCIHHRKENEDALLDAGFTIIDDVEAMERLVPNFYKSPV